MSIVIIFLTACGGQAEETAGKETEQPQEAPKQFQEKEEEEQEQTRTATKILKKSAEATNDLESFSLEMTLEQELTNPTDKGPIQIKSAIKTDLIVEPMIYYMKMKMDIPAMDEQTALEMYFVEDGFYFHDPMMNQWLKTTRNEVDALFGDKTHVQLSPAEQLKELESFTDDFQVTEGTDVYTFALTSSDRNFIEWIHGLSPNLDSFNDLEQQLDTTTINNLSYKIDIHKESFLPVAFTLDIDITRQTKDGTFTFKQLATGTYTNFNEIDRIIIPEAIKENAIDMNGGSYE